MFDWAAVQSKQIGIPEVRIPLYETFLDVVCSVQTGVRAARRRRFIAFIIIIYNCQTQTMSVPAITPLPLHVNRQNLSGGKMRGRNSISHLQKALAPAQKNLTILHKVRFVPGCSLV